MGARSKGCVTCKARRVKCDETHPICNRCRKSGIDCAGYQPIVFVDETLRIQRAQAVARRQQQEMAVLRGASIPIYRSNRVGASRSPDSVDHLLPTLPLTAFEENIFVSFLVSKLSESRIFHEWEGAPPDNLTRYGSTTPGWIDMMMADPRTSFRALAAMFFSKAHGLGEAQTTAIKLYGEALPALRNALMCPENAFVFEVLACMTALCMFELITNTSGMGWLRHANGLAWLLEMRGPWRHKTYPEKSIFLEHRAILVSRAIYLRKRTFLSQRIWRDVPWEDDPQSKKPIDFLVDLLADISELIADIDEDCRGITALDFCSFKNRAVNTLHSLNAWWEDWLSKHPKACKEVPSTSEPRIIKDADRPPFPKVLAYDGLWTANIVITHDALRILLLQVWQFIVNADASVLKCEPDLPFDKPNDTPLLGISSDIHGLAREVLRSLEYCHEHSECFLGTICSFLALDVAYGVLDKESREGRWLWENAWTDLSKMNGFRVTREPLEEFSLCSDSLGTGAYGKTAMKK